jgi:hypothetical protein
MRLPREDISAILVIFPSTKRLRGGIGNSWRRVLSVPVKNPKFGAFIENSVGMN